ncbi:uncharacterized protein PRCAT00002678001 [Priceomyces carsonii]|uniref:uncharacterized protein n=1 Tax=Priceomyces carsonii TaxID=28549 RepID=UPI002EDB7BB6|nr:unnamed protein product [Priceomyces carsonii]
MSAAKQFFSISTYKTAARCWIPVNQALRANGSANLRFYSSQNINVKHRESSNGANDATSGSSDETFHPTVFSSDEVHTAGPVNKA